MLAFLIKAAVAALKKFPDFNASLDGDNLVLKQLLPHRLRRRHARTAWSCRCSGTPTRRACCEIAQEMGELSREGARRQARPGRHAGRHASRSPVARRHRRHRLHADHQRARSRDPRRVASRAMKPVWDGKAFAPRLMLPLSLSYDHRVIDGAPAARFTAYLAQPARRHAARRCSNRERGRHGSTIEVKVPDIGDFKDVPVIEVLRQARRRGQGRGLAGHAGVRQGDDGRARRPPPARSRNCKVKVGDKVAEGVGDPACSRPLPPARRAPQRRSRARGARPPPRRRAAPPPAAAAPVARRRAATPARPTSSARCWCSAPAPAATPPRSAPPTSA